MTSLPLALEDHHAVRGLATPFNHIYGFALHTPPKKKKKQKTKNLKSLKGFGLPPIFF